MKCKWKVLVVDNSMVTREGIAAILKRVDGVELVMTCESFSQALEALEKTSFNLVLIDLQLGRSTGILAGRELLGHYPGLNIMVYSKVAGTSLLSELYRQEYVELSYRKAGSRNGNLIQTFDGNSVTALTLSLHGYILIENITPEIFEESLGYLKVYGKFVDQEIAGLLSELLDKSKLTPRELQCSELISRGKSNQEIADELGISRRAVENLINSVYHKLLIKGEPKDPSRRVLLALTMQRW
jgi:DNA-binding NarL/FixJ family response regulator